MKNTGVIIARFQTPYLHEGHKYLLNEIRAKHNKVIIVLGVSPVRGSRRNPFDFYTRERMIKQYDPSFIILPLNDEPSDTLWSTQLDTLLSKVFSTESFLLYGSRDSFIPYYSGRFAVHELPGAGNYSATAIREDCADKVKDSEDFRMGINYAYHNTYSKVYPTVDIAVLGKDNTVLMGKKAHTTAWRFPGGFTDVADDCFEAAAEREMREECGDLTTAGMLYIGSARIDDWRYRNEVDKITTLFFKTNWLAGNPVAADDLSEVAWVPVKNLTVMMQEHQIAEEHHVLVNMLLKNLQVAL